MPSRSTFDRRQTDTMNFRLSAIVLVLANLVPLGGVFLFGWQVFDILLLYWAENVIIGIVNVIRMAMCRTRDTLFLIPFFIVHYGLFCFGHLSAVVALFGDAQGIDSARELFFGMTFAEAVRSPLWLGIAAIFASHLVSFFSNFVAGGEYRNTSARALMQRPYGRIVALHIAVIIGAALTEWLGSPVMMLVVLIAVKIAMDLKLHATERRKLSDPLPLSRRLL